MEAATSLGGFDPEVHRRAMREIERAISLDSNFAAAWGILATYSANLAFDHPSDSSASRFAREMLLQAELKAPNEPFVLLQRARVNIKTDSLLAAALPLVERALAAAPEDATILTWSASFLAAHDIPRARALVLRAATLNPRDPLVLANAAWASRMTRDWRGATSLYEAIIALDSADERGWNGILSVAYASGDSAAATLAFSRAVANVKLPSTQLAGTVAFFGGDGSRWVLSRSLSQYRVKRWSDSLSYYDGKTVAALAFGDERQSRAYSDSVVRLTARHHLVGYFMIEERLMASFALANLGEQAKALGMLQRIVADARRYEAKQFPTQSFDVTTLAASYSRAGDDREAMTWITAAVGGGEPASLYARDPRLIRLRASPEFQSFLRKQPK